MNRHYQVDDANCGECYQPWPCDAQRLSEAMRTVRAYAAEIERDAITGLPSLRASLIQEVADRVLGEYPPRSVNVTEETDQ